jgi:hypothetical protein
VDAWAINDKRVSEEVFKAVLAADDAEGVGGAVGK